MSSVYVSEPPSKGKVILTTTMGPLDIELWPKEAPKAVRNFVQLCLEGYYDGTIFHRVITSFLVQGGDPTGSGTGGESIYGSTFVDEFHSRLRFNHRGLVACANAGPPHSNGSQFFITLDRCDGLDRKNTIFGKVTGDSIYNLLRLGEVETDKDDRPLDPPKLLSVEVLWNPFDDIIPRQLHQKPLSEQKTESMGKHQMKAVKNLNMLSFGEEAEEEEKELEAIGKDKVMSIHDVLDDPRFIKGEEANYESSVDAAKKKDAHLSVREALSSKKYLSNLDDSDKLDQDLSDSEEGFDARMRLQILKKRRELGDIPNGKIAIDKPKHDDHETLSSRGNNQEAGHASKVEKLSIKKRGIGSEVRAERLATADTDLQLLGQAEKERHMRKQKKRMNHGREEDTLAKMARFMSCLKTPVPSSTSVTTNENSDEDVPGWNLNRLKFIPDPSGDDPMERKDDPNDIDVLDPLLAKGKGFNRREAKLRRRERDWAGKPIT